MNKDLEKIIKEIECYQNDDMCLIMLSQKENKALLDYITNLQQENERKERLITQYGEGMCAYANRIDKAIEYIKANCSYDEDTNMCCDDLFCGDADDLLNILQNGGDSQ